jgi:hypothetical protein
MANWDDIQTKYGICGPLMPTMINFTLQIDHLWRIRDIFCQHETLWNEALIEHP